MLIIFKGKDFNVKLSVLLLKKSGIAWVIDGWKECAVPDRAEGEQLASFQLII